MFITIENVLTKREVEDLRSLAARANFIDGRISAPGATVKNNMILGEPDLVGRSAQMIADALYRNEDFRVFAFPKAMIPPLLTKYSKGMFYGTHVDSAFMPHPSRSLRSDLSCTIFLSDPESYDGGDLVINLGTSEVRLRAPAGAAVVYPSTMLHRVEEVTHGERLIALTFIESRIADTAKRELLYELNEIGAIAGEKMDIDTYTRLQRVQQNLLRQWGDPE
jgi:PKHD-type hydroxylase